MQAGEFDEEAFFDALAKRGARVLLIGRQAMIALGVPVLTSDYDLWAHIDDLELLNGAMARLDLYPSCPPEQARRQGR